MRQKAIGMFVVASVVVLSGCSLPSSQNADTTTIDTGQTQVKTGDGAVSVKTGEGQVDIGGGMNEETPSTNMTQPSQMKKNIVVVFDASGSMNETLNGEKKIDIAKRSVGAYIDTLASDVNLSLLVYGHVGSNSTADKTISCDTVDEQYYLGPVNTAVVKGKVNTLPAKGWTPISKALDKANTILASHAGEDNRIILVSDGMETCGGDPIAVAQKIKAAKGRVDVIGFDVTGATAVQLEKISVEGGGGYVSVKSGNDFSVIINNGTLETITPGATVNIGADGKLDVSTSGATVNTRNGSVDMKTDDGTSVKVVPGQVPQVTVPSVAQPYPGL